MKKPLVKVTTDGDERLQKISAESSALGYFIAMIGIFITLMVGWNYPSANLMRSLLTITFFGSAAIVTVHSVTRNGHPFLTTKHEKKLIISAWVMLLIGFLVFAMGLWAMIGSFTSIEQIFNSLVLLILGWISVWQGVVILKRIRQNRLEEQEEVE